MRQPDHGDGISVTLRECIYDREMELRFQNNSNICYIFVTPVRAIRPRPCSCYGHALQLPSAYQRRRSPRDSDSKISERPAPALLITTSTTTTSKDHTRRNTSCSHITSCSAQGVCARLSPFDNFRLLAANSPLRRSCAPQSLRSRLPPQPQARPRQQKRPRPDPAAPRAPSLQASTTSRAAPTRSRKRTKSTLSGCGRASTSLRRRPRAKKTLPVTSSVCFNDPEMPPSIHHTTLRDRY